MLNRQTVEEVLHYLEVNQYIRLSSSSSNWQQLYCPFHNNGQERRPSCGCSLQEEVRAGIVFSPGTFHCFSCGAVYSLKNGVTEILKMHNTSISMHPVLINLLDSDSANSQAPSLIPSDLIGSVLDKYAAESLRLRMQSKQHFVSEQELASYRFFHPYMFQRRLTQEVIMKYDVGFDAHHIPPGRSKELPCITFPVRDKEGHTLFFCRRSIEGKYFNYPQGVTKPVYGLFELPPDCTSVIICESVFNCLTAVTYGYNAVALLGTGNSYQISQLKQLGVHEYVICLDPDDAGEKGTAKLKKALSGSAFVWTIQMPPGKDLNDCSKEEFDALYAQKF